MGLLDRLPRNPFKPSGVYDGPVVYSSEGPGGAPCHYAAKKDGSPNYRRPLTWHDPDPDNPEPTEGAGYRHRERGDRSHMDAYHRNEVPLALTPAENDPEGWDNLDG